MIIEIDGSQHIDQKEYDAIRAAILENYGYKVLRFWNRQVTKEIESVLDLIYQTTEQRKKDLNVN